MQRSTEKAKTIKVLSGTIPVMVVVSRKQVVAIEKVLESKGTTFQIGGDSLEIKECEIDKRGDYQIRIAVPNYRDSIDLRWHDRISLQDASGKEYKARSWGSMRSGEHCEIDMTYHQSKDNTLGPPSRLIIEDWVTLHHAIPFEFKDVPLP